MAKTVSFIIMSLYRLKNGAIDTEDRAIVRTEYPKEPGTEVRFTDDGKEYFGAVISCIETDEDSDLYRFLSAVAGRTAYIANFVRNNNQKRQPKPPLLCKLFSV